MRGSSILFASTITGFFAGAQRDGELLVAGRDPVARVDDEEDEVGLLDRRARLLRDLGAERVGGEVVDAARVDQQEVLAVPVGEQLLAVARHAGRLVHDGLPRLGQPVDQRRLADVREADDRDRADDLGLDVGVSVSLIRRRRVPRAAERVHLGRARRGARGSAAAISADASR